jgi:polysaccharide export outer membrane protein
MDGLHFKASTHACSSRRNYSTPDARTLSAARKRAPLLLTAALSLGLSTGFTGALTGCTALSVGVSNPTPVGRFIQVSQAYRAQSYRLMPGDQLTMRAYYNPQLDEDVLVRPDGNISLSLLGDIRAAGKTASELSAEITKGYAEYFVKPTAVVIIRQFTGYRVFTAGELRTPGQFSLLTGASTVLEAISASGGVTELGTLTSVIIVRHLPGQAQPMVAELDISEALSGDDPRQDVTLMPNDFVYVPRSGMADFNEALQQYIYRNLNFATSAGFSVGYTIK